MSSPSKPPITGQNSPIISSDSNSEHIEEEVSSQQTSDNSNDYRDSDDFGEDIDLKVGNYAILTYDDLEKKYREDLSWVQGATGVSMENARKLLQIYRGDIEKLTIEFNNDETAVTDSLSCLTLKATEAKHECSICYEEDDLVTLNCGHTGCAVCWKKYTEQKISNAICEFECMEVSCSQIVDEKNVESLLKNPKLFEYFARLRLEKYVHSHSLMKWCPGLDCKNIIMAYSIGCHDVSCDCGTRVCFFCGNIWHQPASCEMMFSWNEFITDTSTWVFLNTKPCPKCRVTIEKNKGCNHMTCKMTECGYEFCWICLGNWQNHSTPGYICQPYDKYSDKAFVHTEHFSIHLRRFMSFQQTLMTWREVVDRVNNITQKFQYVDMIKWIDIQFLNSSMKTLHDCLSVLVHSSIFSYFAPTSDNQNMFNSRFSELEARYEELLHLIQIENPEHFSDHKILTQDKTRQLDQFIKDFIQYTKNMYN